MAWVAPQKVNRCDFFTNNFGCFLFTDMSVAKITSATKNAVFWRFLRFESYRNHKMSPKLEAYASRVDLKSTSIH